MDAETKTDPKPLTEHQQRVFRRLVEGDSNPEIARHLTLSVKTVKAHVSVILKKLKRPTRAKLIVWYYKESVHG